MNDLQQIFNNLDPDARECIEGILERMAMAKIRKHTGKIMVEFHYGQGVLSDSYWKEQLAGKRKRMVRSKGI